MTTKTQMIEDYMNDIEKLIAAARNVGYWAGVLDASSHGYYATVDFDGADLEIKLDAAEATLAQLKGAAEAALFEIFQRITEMKEYLLSLPDADPVLALQEGDEQ